MRFGHQILGIIYIVTPVKWKFILKELLFLVKKEKKGDTMSILIDTLLINHNSGPRVGVNNKNSTSYWVIAKNIELFNFCGRIKDAWRILIGKSRAYHFYEDILLAKKKNKHAK